MNLDYSRAEKAHRRSVRRSVFAASLCAISLAALVGREVTASRQTPQTLPVDEVVSAFPADADSAQQGDLDLQAATDGGNPIAAENQWINITVEPGQAISTLIEDQGMLKYEWMDLMALGKDVASLKSLRAGEKLMMRKNAENKLEELQYEVDETHTLHVQRTDDKLEAFIVAAEMEHRPAQATGVISSSLFADGSKAGLSDQLIMDMAEIFGYDIDFALDLRQGDRFSVVYDELYKNGEKLRDGKILAAEFVNQGRKYRAMRYTGSKGQIGYYTPEGLSMRKAFFRTPLDVIRISSSFNLKRRHPILNIIRAHKGVDYAAATGTPVKATGDARVAFAGVKGGYGNVIILQHGKRYTTLYGHLSRFRPGLRVGSSVSRGQIIGYVGHSGLATAPHLHYEFRVDGQHVNPVTATIARADSLSKAEIAQWRNTTTGLVAQLDAMNPTQGVARNETRQRPR